MLGGESKGTAEALNGQLSVSLDSPKVANLIENADSVWVLQQVGGAG